MRLFPIDSLKGSENDMADRTCHFLVDRNTKIRYYSIRINVHETDIRTTA